MAGQYTIPSVLVLALDTTTPAGSVAVVRGSDLLAIVHGDATRTHGERLPGEIDAALAHAGVATRDLDLLAVASGPGAFTGLRIGLATIQGLAMVLAKPVVGVSALEALAETMWQADASHHHVAAWMDAQRGEVFAATYSRASGTVHASEPRVGPPEAALAVLSASGAGDISFVGDGALRYRALIVEAWGVQARIVEPTPAITPAIAALGQRRAAAGGAGPPHVLQPLYVRRPDAERDRDRQT